MPIGTYTEDFVDVEQAKLTEVADDPRKSDDLRLKSKRTTVVNQIKVLFNRAIADQRSAMTERDKIDFITLGITDSALEAGGAMTEEQKLKNVEEMKVYAERFVLQAKNMGEKFLDDITKAQDKGWISKNSAERWKTRLKKHSSSWPETEAFLRGFDKKYLKNWEAAHAKMKEIEEQKKKHKLDNKKIPELKALEASDFLEKNYHERHDLITKALAAIEAYTKNKKMLKNDAEKELKAAAAEQIISQYRVGPWLEHIVSGKRSLKELQDYIKDWRSIRKKYDDIEEKLDTMLRQPHGFKRIPQDKFLLLTYEQRVSYVQEATWRVNHHINFPEDTPIEDLKGKVRHALDTEDWEDADYYLRKAWDIAIEPSDINELHSLERNLQQFRKRKKATGLDSEQGREEVKRAMAELQSALLQLPQPMRRLYEKALARGAGCMRCVGKTVYNVKWCKDRNYLNEDIIANARSRADAETWERLRPSGKGHGNGLENNRVDGYHKPAIRDKGIGPQNLFLGQDGIDAFIEKADQNKDVYSFWYWTNLIMDGVSIQEYEMVSTVLNPIFRRNSVILQKYGLTFATAGRPFSVN